ncbi:MAG: epoxyqueuosine reductase QueH, partial [Bacteroidales bacterium]|nr:epoxyqueuosine reductase QueH [Bacteroidales bacterium]
APCSGAVLECLRDSGIRPVVFFSNSNIYPRQEYDLRLSELQRYADLMGVELVGDAYDHEAWLEAVRGLEREPERGRRCEVCFRYRLARAASYAAQRSLPVLATTLASSRWKDLDQVNAAGEEVCSGLAADSASEGHPSVTFWSQNWRKGGLQPRRSEIIREQCFYNQDWCGCEFSRRQTL